MIETSIVNICRERLLATKADLLNRFQSHFVDFRERERGGDEADQTVSILNENNLFVSHQRLRFQLLEIEQALARLDRGTYGICEETEQPIEAERLLAIPWTRLSIEGAELREAQSSRKGKAFSKA
jgi:DnaK suppressor protein